MNHVDENVYPTNKNITCSECNAIANHKWNELHIAEIHLLGGGVQAGEAQKIGEDSVYLTVCDGCGSRSIWVGDLIVFPAGVQKHFPATSMPGDAKDLYIKASKILPISSEASGMLLRKALAAICKELRFDKKNLKKSIDSLVCSYPLSTLESDFLLEIMNGVRHVGNAAAHDPSKNIVNSPELVKCLFKFLNIVCYKLITNRSEDAEMIALIQAWKDKKSD